MLLPTDQKPQKCSNPRTQIDCKYTEVGLLRSKNFFISTCRTVTNGIPTPDFEIDQIEFDVQQGNKVGPAIILGILECTV